MPTKKALGLGMLLGFAITQPLIVLSRGFDFIPFIVLSCAVFMAVTIYYKA